MGVLNSSWHDKTCYYFPHFDLKKIPPRNLCSFSWLSSKVSLWLSRVQSQHLSSETPQFFLLLLSLIREPVSFLPFSVLF